MNAQLQTMIDNLPTKTGRSLDGWLELVRDAGHEKHGAIVSFLKKEHGMTHGYANLVSQVARGALERSETPEEAADRLFSGSKEGLRPAYDALHSELMALGDDVEVAPKKGYLSFRRARQFALLQPSTRTRLDVGLRLDDVEPSGRLESSAGWNAMCSHRVRVESTDQVDAELAGWLRQAYEQAG